MNGRNKHTSVLFCTKDRRDAFIDQARGFISQHFTNHTILLGSADQPLPETLETWSGDYIVSYLSPWILPAHLLRRAARAAINFHPAPPEYPGIGCANFAIYEEAREYGVTCHHMDASVDTGKLVAVQRFPVLETDTVFSLTQRSHSFLLTLFYNVMSCILRDQPVPECKESWTRKPFRRAEMFELFRITSDMSHVEIQRRIRAGAYPGYSGAYVEIHGERFYHLREQPR